MNYSSSLKLQSKYDPDISFTLRKPSHGRRMEFDLAASEYRSQIRELQRKHKALSEQMDQLREAWRVETDAKLAQLKRLDTDEAKTEIARIEAGRELEKLRWLYGRADSQELKTEILDKLAAIDTKTAIVFEGDADLVEEMRLLNEESIRLLQKHYHPARIKWGLKAVEGITIDDEVPTVDTLIADGPEELLREILDKIEEVAGLTGEALKLSCLPTGSSDQDTGRSTATTAESAVETVSTEPATA
jgi:hypothetical protein